jgi:hypothetical protein
MPQMPYEANPGWFFRYAVQRANGDYYDGFGAWTHTLWDVLTYTEKRAHELATKLAAKAVRFHD